MDLGEPWVETDLIRASSVGVSLIGTSTIKYCSASELLLFTAFNDTLLAHATE
jgi:hypothetical protein